jgi:hypothetical protein
MREVCLLTLAVAWKSEILLRVAAGRGMQLRGVVGPPGWRPRCAPPNWAMGNAILIDPKKRLAKIREMNAGGAYRGGAQREPEQYEGEPWKGTALDQEKGDNEERDENQVEEEEVKDDDEKKDGEQEMVEKGGVGLKRREAPADFRTRGTSLVCSGYPGCGNRLRLTDESIGFARKGGCPHDYQGGSES